MTTPESARARDDARRRHLSAEPRRALGAQDLDRRMPTYAAAGGVPAVIPGRLPDRGERPPPHRQRRCGAGSLAVAFHGHGNGSSRQADLAAQPRGLPEAAGPLADRARARLRPVQAGDGSRDLHARPAVEHLTTSATPHSARHLARPALSVAGTASPTHAGRAGELGRSAARPSCRNERPLNSRDAFCRRTVRYGYGS
jgi:hypothetical protein